jgi:hypothetical protein
MFPDVRLMVAATLASVVALMLGFGLFAAFRVSHEPLGRLQPAGAPMLLVADNAAIAATTIAPGEPFDRHFQIVAAPTVSETVNVPTPGSDLHDDIETSSVALPTASTTSFAGAREGTSAIGEPKDQPALPADQPAEAPSDVSATAPASDPPASAPQTETATLPAAELHDSVSLAAAADKTVVGPENKSDVATAADTEPAAAPSIADADAGKDWRQDWIRPPPTTLRPNTDAATAGPGKRVARTASRTIEKRCGSPASPPVRSACAERRLPSRYGLPTETTVSSGPIFRPRRRRKPNWLRGTWCGFAMPTSLPIGSKSETRRSVAHLSARDQ